MRKTKHYDYELPAELIAQEPLEKRDESQMLVINPADKSLDFKTFKDLPSLLLNTDVLVFNDSRVIQARLHGIKEGTGAQIELLLLSMPENGKVTALTRNSKAVSIGTKIQIADDFAATAVKIIGDGIIFYELSSDLPIEQAIEKYGEMPLPPYINKELKDKERYQTIYGNHLGSVAAPTAGLHFTNEIFEKLAQKNIRVCYITLHVGLGTFRPVKVENLNEHQMHEEFYTIPPSTAMYLNKALLNNDRIIAVGTTALRALETNYRKNNFFTPETAKTDIFIYPPQEVQSVDALITNFHLPKSTLLMLVSAIAGINFTLTAYKRAVKKELRFFSFGDSSFIYNNRYHYRHILNNNVYLQNNIYRNEKLARKPRLLLHTCCAPCLIQCIDFLHKHYRITIFYDNSNIYPKEEYDKRLEEIKRFIKFFNTQEKADIKVVVTEYDESLVNYCHFQVGVEDNNYRCFTCISRRLKKTMEYSNSHRYDYFATTLTTSLHKPMIMINDLGWEIGKMKKRDNKYIPTDFRPLTNMPSKAGDYFRILKIYRQKYCGCQPNEFESLGSMHLRYRKYLESLGQEDLDKGQLLDRFYSDLKLD